AGYLNWSTLNWPSFVGAFWLLILIAVVTSLACMSQLAYMVALLRRAIRDDLTGVFARNSGEEILQVQWNTSLRNNSALAVSFVRSLWPLVLTLGVACLADMSQLGSMVAVLRRAIRDDLPGVFARISGEEILQVQSNTRLRHNSALFVAFIDLDDFVQINDRH